MLFSVFADCFIYSLFQFVQIVIIILIQYKPALDYFHVFIYDYQYIADLLDAKTVCAPESMVYVPSAELMFDYCCMAGRSGPAQYSGGLWRVVSIEKENQSLSDINQKLESELNTLIEQLAIPSVRNLIFAVDNALIEVNLYQFPPVPVALPPICLGMAADLTRRKNQISTDVYFMPYE